MSKERKEFFIECLARNKDDILNLLGQVDDIAEIGLIPATVTNAHFRDTPIELCIVKITLKTADEIKEETTMCDICGRTYDTCS
jgi:thymidine kinase